MKCWDVQSKCEIDSARSAQNVDWRARRGPIYAAALVVLGLAAAVEVSAQDESTGVLRLNRLVEQPAGDRYRYSLGQELRDVLPVVDVNLGVVEVPLTADGKALLRDAVGPTAFPPGAEYLTVRIQSSAGATWDRVQLSNLRGPEGGGIFAALYSSTAPANVLENTGFDQYSTSFIPVAWQFDVVPGRGAFIGGTPAEPDGRTFTMDLLPRPDGADSAVWQSIALTSAPPEGTRAVATVEALAEGADSLFLELALIGEDETRQVLASVAHPGTGRWARIRAEADVPAGTPRPVLEFRMRRSAIAEGRTAFDNASLIVPRAFPRFAKVAVASAVGTRYRTQALTVPAQGTLEFGIGAIYPPHASRPVTFRALVATEAGQVPVFESTVLPGDASAWQDHRVDLSRWAGKTVQLAFESQYAGNAAEPNGSTATDTSMPLWGDVVLTGRRPEGTGRAADVILVSIDTLRADHLGVYGYPRATSPALDRFAESAYVFENCYSASSWTTPAHASAFTGLLPSVHGAGIRRGEHSQRSRLPEGATTFAERAQALGYRTAAFTEGYFAASRWGLAQGFDRYHDGRSDLTPESKVIEETLGRGSAWLRGTGSQPHLLFLHTYVTHWPYAAPEPYRSRFLTNPNSVLPDATAAFEGRLDAAGFEAMRDFYDGGIAYMDDVLGRFLNRLSAEGVLDNTWVIVFSDHGEEFGEHGKTMHGFTLYDEVLHVPFIVRPPGGLEKPRRISDVVGLADLYATILDILGDTTHEVPPSSVSVLPLMANGSARTRRAPAVGELVQHRFETYAVSARNESMKYIASTHYGRDDAAIPGTVTDVEVGLNIDYPIAVLERAKGNASTAGTAGVPSEELYDVLKTPNESINLAGSELVLKGTMRDSLLDHLRRIRETVGTALTTPELAAPLGPEELERLKAIGYVD